MIIIAGVIESAGREVVTVGINGDLVLVVAEVGAATLLVDGMEDVEELADVAELVVGREGIELGEGGSNEARFGREVAGEADGAHAAAIKREVDLGSDGVDGVLCGQVLVIAELEELLVERRVVGEDADRVVVDFETVFHGFDNDAAGRVSDDPVKLGNGELVGEVDIAKIELGEEGFGFGEVGALAENPRDELKLRNVVFAIGVRIINGVADEVETGDTETFLIDGIVEKGIAVGDVSDADHSVMGIQSASFTESKREIAWDNYGFFAVRKFVVEVATEVIVFISGGCTHGLVSLF